MFSATSAMTRLKLTVAAAALLSAGSFLGSAVKQRISGQTKSVRWRGRTRYPEQSQRQAMRRFRRARGGPGIYFNEYDGKWLPRGCGSFAEHLQNLELGVQP